MAISTTRVKFLDKENKVLVKPIKDFVSNAIFSDFVTSFLDTDLVSSFLGQQSLLDLQNGVNSLTTLLSDAAVSNFSVSTLLNGIDFSSPQLAHLATTIAAIKGMDDKTVNLFVSSLLEVATDKLTDNPSLVNLYQSVSNDIKTQTLLSSLDIFANKLSTGQTTLTGYSDQLKQTAGSDFDLVKVNTLLAAVRSNTKTIDLSKVITGNATLASSFLAGLTALEVKELKDAAGTGGATSVGAVVPVVTVGTGITALPVTATVGEVTGTTYTSVTNIRVGDTVTTNTGIIPSPVAEVLPPDMNVRMLRIVYLSIKRDCILAYLRASFSLYNQSTLLDYVQTPEGKDFFTRKLTGDIKVAPADQADLFMRNLSELLLNIASNATGALPLSQADLTGVFTTISNAIASVLAGLLSETSSKIDNTFSIAPAIVRAVSYINNPEYTQTPGVAFAGFAQSEVVNDLLAHISALANERVAAFIGADGEDAGSIIAYTYLQIIGYLLSVTNVNIKSYYSLVNVTQFAAPSIYNFKVGPALAALGYPLGSMPLTARVSEEYVAIVPKFFSGVKKSIVFMAHPRSHSPVDIVLCMDLRSFIGTISSVIGQSVMGLDLPGGELNSYSSLLKLYDIYSRSSLDIDKARYYKEAVPLSQIAFSLDSTSVIIN